MAIKLIFFWMTIFFVSCSPKVANFKIKAEMQGLILRCSLKDEVNSNYSGCSLFFDTIIKFQIINMSKTDIIFFHDKTFIVSNSSKFSPLEFRETSTIIRYFDVDKKEIYGRFNTISIDSSFVGPEYFTSEIIDTSSHIMNKNGSLSISQKLQLPYGKGTLFISIDDDVCEQIHFVQFCISQGRKKKNKFFGCACCDFIPVVQK